MSTKRLVFLVVPAAFRVLLAGFLDMLAALIFLAYRVRWLLAEVAPMTLRLVHDPDTGCSDCPFNGDRHSNSVATCYPLSDDLSLSKPAPEECPLRSGDVVVSAK